VIPIGQSGDVHCLPEGVVTTTIKAVYEGGVFKPREPVSLEDHAEVEVLIPDQTTPSVDDPTGWKAIRRLIGAGKTMSPNVAERHDDHLYDDPEG
jgi:predicted DNA-binding antitoxin AbrB/MazE fold protein